MLALPFLWSAGLPLRAAELRTETAAAFDAHVAARERLPVLGPDQPFLWASGSAERQRRLRDGEIVVTPRHGKGDIAVDGGLIHHWVGAAFVPGHSLSEALALLQNYDAHQDIYVRSVDASRTLRRDGNRYDAYLRLRAHKIVTVVLNTEHHAEYVTIDARRAYSRSFSTRIAEVKGAGTPAERELPLGNDSGFLWRIATFWRLEETHEGVYLECEVIGLTRGVPFGLGWLIRPIIRSLPRESLTELLDDTREAMLGRRPTRTDRNTVSQATRSADSAAH